MKMPNIFYLLTNQLQYLVAQPSTAWWLAFWDTFPNKNLIHHCLYAFITSTRTTLETFFQSIKPYSNQILCSTHEQSDFKTSISYFSFSLLPSFLFFSHFFSYLFFIFFHYFLSFPCPFSTKNGTLKQVVVPPINRKHGATPWDVNSWHPLIITCLHWIFPCNLKSLHGI